MAKDRIRHVSKGDRPKAKDYNLLIDLAKKLNTGAGTYVDATGVHLRPIPSNSVPQNIRIGVLNTGGLIDASIFSANNGDPFWRFVKGNVEMVELDGGGNLVMTGTFEQWYNPSPAIIWEHSIVLGMVEAITGFTIIIHANPFTL